MIPEYLAVCFSSDAVPGAIAHVSGFAQSLGLPTIFKSDRLLVFANQKYEAHTVPDGRGVIIGDIFCRHVPAKAFDGTPSAASAVATSIRDGRLTEEYWGSYVALLLNDNGDQVCIRSPFGNINAYTILTDGLVYIGSDAATLLSIAAKPRTINWEAIARHVIWDDYSHESTCLADIGEVRCGESAKFDRKSGLKVAYNWDPWRFVSADGVIQDREKAVELVRREILRCVGARLDSNRPSAIDLSGGLDSSIIAAAAAKNGRSLSAITMYLADTEGDERDFARSVAERLEIPLHEASPNPEKLDIARAAKLHLPRPYARSFVQDTDRLSLEIAIAESSSVFLNGQGGDAVFCHLQSSGPAADALRSLGSGPGFFRTAFEVGRAAQCSIWEVTRKGVVKALTGKSVSGGNADFSYVSVDTREVNLDGRPPWPSPDFRPLPGKVEHVLALYNSCYNLNGYRRSDTLKGVYPLLSQPLVEACLRIPTWMWVGGGRNRLVAREAMERDLPSKVAWRVSKGGLGDLQRRLLRRQRSTAREMLMEGSLSRNGILDRRAIDAELASDLSYRQDQIMRLLRLCDFEAWCSGGA